MSEEGEWFWDQSADVQSYLEEVSIYVTQYLRYESVFRASLERLWDVSKISCVFPKREKRYEYVLKTSKKIHHSWNRTSRISIRPFILCLYRCFLRSWGGSTKPFFSVLCWNGIFLEIIIRQNHNIIVPRLRLWIEIWFLKIYVLYVLETFQRRIHNVKSQFPKRFTKRPTLA